MLGALSAETITYLSWMRDRCLATFVSLKIHVERVLIDSQISDLTFFTHSERVSKFSFSRLAHCLAYFATESIRILKLCFQFMDLGSQYLGPLARGVVDNFKVTSYNVTSRIIYEWGTCTGAIRRLRLVFEIANIEIMEHVFVNKYCCCYSYDISTDP